MQRSALCRSRRELSNEYLLAKIGVDTAENEPLEVCGKIFNIIHWCAQPSRFFAGAEAAGASFTSASFGGFAEPGSNRHGFIALAEALVERFGIEPFPDFFRTSFSKMSKLLRALSLLYRRQILQENMRWKALTRSARFTSTCLKSPHF